jgi:predicted AAA+ superfamily ATPase
MSETSFEKILNRLADALERLSPAPKSAPVDAPAYQWGNGGPTPIRQVDWMEPGRLVGVDDALALLDANTRRFVSGKPANDVLLWGERGTGKSSLVKAMLRRYHDQGLRLVGVRHSEYESISQIADWVETQDGRKFILFLDDFSFSADDAAYRELKTILEGGLRARPVNLLVYATSNRRHLVPEYLVDNEPVIREGEIHPREAVQERISLSDRFGMRIGLYAPDQDTYLETVDSYLRLYGFQGAPGTLHQEAIRFALQAGQRSGRTAHQFVRSLDIP